MKQSGLDRFLLDQNRFFLSQGTTQKTQPPCYNEKTKRRKNLEKQAGEQLSNTTWIEHKKCKMLTEIVSRSFHYTALYYEKGRPAEFMALLWNVCKIHCVKETTNVDWLEKNKTGHNQLKAVACTWLSFQNTLIFHDDEPMVSHYRPVKTLSEGSDGGEAPTAFHATILKR